MRGEYKWKGSALEFPQIKIQGFEKQFTKTLIVSLLFFSKDWKYSATFWQSTDVDLYWN